MASFKKAYKSMKEVLEENGFDNEEVLDALKDLKKAHKKEIKELEEPEDDYERDDE